MCGIIGAVDYCDRDITWIDSASESINHRGPDHKNTYIDNDFKLAFHHLRLSIIDLSYNASQPMCDDSKKFYIIFNGEIYNYKIIRSELISKGVKFRSNSDTEVLLKGYMTWGEKILNKLNGAFSFAIFDKSKKKIFIARDRAGEKPLFYYYDKNIGFFFASELKALMQNKHLERSIDIKSLNYLFSVGYVPGNQCILNNFKKLPPASFIQYDLCNKKLELKKYWSLPENETSNISLDECTDSLFEILKDSVKLQLNSDVPLGILLSGGLDSSLITAIASGFSSNIKTYNVSFPGFKNFDESEHAKLIASYFSTDHTEITIDSEIIDNISQLAYQIDEPMIDSSIIPTYLLTKAIKNHCTVAIGGDGGDELFGGYTHYSRFLKMNKYMGKIPKSLRDLFVEIVNRLPHGLKGKSYLNSLNINFKKELPYSNFFINQNFLKNILKENYLPNFVNSHRKKLISSDDDIIQRATRYDFNNYLPEDILVKTDRASMLNSLELRAPFLDYRLIEFAFKIIPSNYKVTIDNKKIILKNLASKILPKNFNLNRKQGFSIPLNDWLNNNKKNLNFFKDILLDKSSFFDQNAIEILFKEQKKGFSNGERLFGFLMFEIWRSHYSVK